MSIENLVCSAESGKRLKELGVKVPSYFEHIIYPKSSCIARVIEHDNLTEGLGGKSYPAYLFQELWDAVPESITYDSDRIISLSVDKYRVETVVSLGEFYEDNPAMVIKKQCDKNASEAMAQMVIYLIENKYVTAEEINGK